MNRKEIKRQARELIRGNLWDLFKPQLLLMVISSMLLLIFDVNNLNPFAANTIIQFIGIMLYPISIGIIGYMLKFVRKEEYNIKDIFSYYSLIIFIIAMYLLIGIFTFLWTLLFIIPGIIATFSYIMAPYIFADGEQDPLECIKKSKSMMNGYKLDYFTFSLSFIGWIFIAIFAFWYVIPYLSVSQALYYEELKKISKID